MGLNPTKVATLISVELRVFSAQFSPHTVGRRRPLSAWGVSRKGARRQAIFFKVIDRNWWFLHGNYHYFDIFRWIFDQISMSTMKDVKFSKHFQKITKNFSNFFFENLKKKKKTKKIGRNIFFIFLQISTRSEDPGS